MFLSRFESTNHLKLKSRFRYYLGRLILRMGKRRYLDWVDDENYIRLIFYCVMGYSLNLRAPRTFNEKLQWLKLYDKKPSYSDMVDKLQVRSHVRQLIGPQYLVNLLGVYKSPDEIDLERLPDSFVLKATSSSNMVMICHDKSKLKKSRLAKRFKSWQQNKFYHAREWPYKTVTPRIICEEMLVDDGGRGPDDYKFLCFHGEPRVVEYHRDRFGSHTQDFYDIEWNKLPVSQGSSTSDCSYPKPENFDEMLRIARILSAEYAHIRIDLYNLNGKIYFGEMTFYDSAGFDPIEPYEYDLLWGSWINLETINK